MRIEFDKLNYILNGGDVRAIMSGAMPLNRAFGDDKSLKVEIFKIRGKFVVKDWQKVEGQWKMLSEVPFDDIQQAQNAFDLIVKRY